MEIVADTHILVWYLAGSKSLSIAAKKTMDGLAQGKGRLIIPIIVFIEILSLIEKKKIKFSWNDFNRQIISFPNVIVYPIELDVFEMMQKVGENLELHDRMIVATAMIHKAIIVTKDEKIRVEKYIKTVW